MDQPVLPKYFRESNTETAQAVRIMSGMQHKLIEHFYDQTDFLNKMTQLSELKQQRLYMYYPSILMYPDTAVWARLTTKQKSDLSASYLVVDPVTFECSVPGLLNVDSIGTALRREAFNLRKDQDYTVTKGLLKFISSISVEDWDRTTVSVSISGRPVPVAIPVIPVLMYKAWFEEDWYYKRIGILLGLPEYTPPAQVLATYKLFLESSTEANLDAIFAAYKDFDISLRENDIVTEMLPGKVITEKEIYVVPEFTAEDTFSVGIGSELSVGDPLVDMCCVVNDTSFPGWTTNPYLLNKLKGLSSSEVSELETGLRDLISNNSKLLWGKTLPIRISTTDEESLGLWLSAPVINLPVLKFSLGSDAVPTKVAAGNMVLYSTLDVPKDYDIKATYNAGTKTVTLVFDGVLLSEECSVDSGGVFVSVDTGVSGRVLVPASNGNWSGSLIQKRGSVVLKLSDTHTLEFDVSACTFNDGFNPDIGDWIWFEVGTSGLWKKAKITNLITNDDQVPITLYCMWYGNDVPAAGTYPAIIFQSYNGDPYTGVDAARLDAFGELLEVVSRHIEVVIVNKDIITAAEAKACLLKYKQYINVWKAFIVIEAEDSKSFLAIKENLNEYI